MAMSAATLKNGLALMTPTNDMSLVVSRITSAFNNYFAQMEAGGATAVTVALGTAAFQASIAGLGNGNAAAKITAAVTAFWGALVAASAFPSAVGTAITPPPGISGLTAALEATFSANISNERSLNDAAQQIADAVHATQSGAILAWSLPPASGTYPIT